MIGAQNPVVAVEVKGGAIDSMETEVKVVAVLETAEKVGEVDRADALVVTNAEEIELLHSRKRQQRNLLQQQLQQLQLQRQFQSKSLQ
jgi:F0F1-type ATP synthase epsilon subunit